MRIADDQPRKLSGLLQPLSYRPLFICTVENDHVRMRRRSMAFAGDDMPSAIVNIVDLVDCPLDLRSLGCLSPFPLAPLAPPPPDALSRPAPGPPPHRQEAGDV